ncbi:MAG: aromatic ring-hydroxylating dioxygenase subunit alpha [Deltaproteobacteria bacterium]|nr:aromatic ring-hydroxylating dioxygenase subunit alpha [Deltaproteobacteria bacterium]
MNAPQQPSSLWSSASSATSSGGRKNVARVVDAWYVACASKELGKSKPLAVQILGVPLALWRTSAVGGGAGAPAAVLDRCPHRNVPLSLGRVEKGELECRYHGWRFDPGGKLTAVPGLPIVDEQACVGQARDGGHRCVDGYRVVERDGFVWVWLSPRDPATTLFPQPLRLAQLDGKGYTHIRQSMRVEGTLHSTLENILDVPHTAFLHGGLFRTSEKKHEIEAIVQRRRDGVEAEFVGEPRPVGVVGRVLSPSGGLMRHWDRFLLPSTAQVEYRLGDENHILVTTLCTPVSETVTDMHTVLSLRTRLPVGPIAFLAGPIAWRILAQDKEILKAQTGVVDRFGTERFTSTSIDLLGPYILHLLKKAEQGALDEAIVREERTRLRV